MGPVKEVDKTSSGVPTDSFRNAGIFVYYKEPGITEAVEFGGPSSPTFRDQDFLGRFTQSIKTVTVTRHFVICR